MKQQNNRSISKPVKSLSARTFFKSARKSSPNQHSKRIQTLRTEPVEIQTFTATKRHLQLQSKTSRLVLSNWKKQTVGIRSKEELADQNHKLKLKINKLQEDLLKQKSKYMQHAKELNKLHKQFDVDFQKQKYYESGQKQTNMVEGVKYQYHKTKQKYQEKCKEHESLMKRFQSSSGEEYKFYCEALQIDNKKLKENLAFLVKFEDQMIGQFKDHHFVDRRKEGEVSEKERIADILGVSANIVILQKRIDNSQQKYNRLKQKMKTTLRTLTEKNKKIQYLDKIITQKGNQIHTLIWKERKTQAQLKSKLQLIAQLKTRLQIQQQRHHHMIEVFKQKENTKFETQKTIFIASLKQKDAEIQKLNTEVNYYSAIFSYLKTGEDPFKIQPATNSLSKKNSFRENSKSFLMNIEKSLISLQGGNQPSLSARKRVKTLFQSGLKDLSTTYKDQNAPQTNTQALKDIRIISDDQYEGNSSSGSHKQSQLSQLQPRKIKKSNIKYSQSAVKMRHIKPSQISHLKKQLIYRFIFYRLSIDQAKQHLSFDLSKELDSNLSQKERKWRVNYISMKEIKEKLMAKPFEMKDEDATLLGRYIVEDSAQDDVYFQQQNQVERTIAKSIIRAFVGEYTLPDELQCRKELSQILQKSGKNLRSALNSLAPTGSLSAAKLIQICQNIQIDFSQPLKNWLLSQLFSKTSNDLSHLEYRYLFEGL